MSSIVGVFLTVLSGTLVYVVGQWITRFLIEPVQDLRREIGKVEWAMVFYGNRYIFGGQASPDRIKKTSEVSDALRDSASRLSAASKAVCLPALSVRLWGIPDREALRRAVSNLIGLSNGVVSGRPQEVADTEAAIRRDLGLE